ncbi:MAG TPA: hypothetical protein EYH54_03560 [Nautiliaceae bacterium]|nr:hypothetical protein [Nautiliaceae bacterium]
MFAFPREEDIINFNLKKNKVYFHLLGVPYDENSVNPEINTKLFPKKIREMSYKVYSTLFADIRKVFILDHGDIDIKELDNKIFEIEKNYKKKNVFLFLGGNHLMTYYTFQTLNKIRDIDLIISFDAHPDVYYGKLSNSSFFRYLLRNFDVEIVFLALSNPSYEELDFLRNKKISFYSSIEFEDNLRDLAKEINNLIKDKNIYLTVDLDVFKNNIASFQAEILGIEPKNFLIFLKKLDIRNFVGMDFVEFDPTKDINNSYSLMATRIILESLAIINEKLTNN